MFPLKGHEKRREGRQPATALTSCANMYDEMSVVLPNDSSHLITIRLCIEEVLVLFMLGISRSFGNNLVGLTKAKEKIYSYP